MEEKSRKKTQKKDFVIQPKGSSRSHLTKTSLTDSEEKYQILFNSIDDGFCIIEVIFNSDNKPVDYRFLEINPAFKRQTGLHHAEGKLMRSLVPEHEENWFQTFGRIALTGKPERFVNEVKVLNRWYDVYAFRVGVPENRRVAVVFNDITKSKKSEDELANTIDVTDRKKAEQRLIESEEKFYKAFHLSPIGMILITLPDGRFVEINDSLLKMLEYSRYEVIGHTTAEMKLYAEPTGREQVWQAILEQGKLENYEMTWQTKTGRIITVTCSNENLTLNGQQHAIFTIMDITERKKMEEEVVRLNRELKAIDECDQIIVHENDEQALLAKVCRILCTTGGYLMTWVGAVEHNENKSVLTLAWCGDQDYLAKANITWADTERGRGPTGLAVRTGKTHFFQDFATEPAAAPWRKAALSLGYRSSIAIPLFDDNGSVFEILALYSREPNYFNPAEVRLLEELAGNLSFGINTIRERAKRQKAEAEISHLASFPGLNPNPVIELDANCNIKYANPAVQTCFPDLVIQGSKHPFLADLDNMIPHAVANSITRDINVSNAWYEQTLAYTAPTDTYLLYARDVTARKNADMELIQRSAALELANKELETFSYSVSHDLRAPLRSMDGFSLALMEDYNDKLDDTAKEYLQYIRSSSQLMGRLIDDILNLSRITRAEIHLDKVDMSELANEVVDELNRIQPDRKVEFLIAPKLEAYGDRNLLKLVMQNLLGNAFKFTGKQDHAIIEFGIANSGGEKAYFVRDNGIGFDMTYDDKLFKPFQRLHSAEEFPGTGVGLASVQRIINRLGGRVWAEGNPGHGAMFCFTLVENEEV